MKTAEQWQKELNGETSVESIRQIQADAMREAARIVGDNLEEVDCCAELTEAARKVSLGGLP